MKSGWFRDSYRHSLAARGISTARFKPNRFSYMPRDVVTKVYKFDELSPEAQEKAIEWWRDMRNRNGWYSDDFELLVDDWRNEMNEKYPGLDLGRTDVEWDLYQGELRLPSRDVDRLLRNEFDSSMYDIEFDGSDLRYDREVGEEDFFVDLNDDKYFDKNGIQIAPEVLKHNLKRKAANIVSSLQKDMGDLFKRLKDQEEYVESDDYAKSEIEANDYEFKENGDRF